MKSNRIVQGHFAGDTAKTARGYAGVINSLVMALLFFVLAAPSVWAQASAIRLTTAQVRVTVPVLSTNSSAVVTIVNITQGATNAAFTVDLSGLPSGVGIGASAVLTDTNGNALTYTEMDTNLLLTLNTTNIPQGTYQFYLNAGGTDTNNAPTTNSLLLVLQAAHIWNGNGVFDPSFGVSNNWAQGSPTVTNWLGGIPGPGDDVVIGDGGAQTNLTFISGSSFTNIGISSSITVASMRFAQSVYTNLTSTNSLHHTIQLSPGVTVSVTGTNGFSLMRDYIGDLVPLDRTIGVNIIGTNATLVVSNVTANFSILLGNQVLPSLNMSNLSTFVSYVNRMGLGEYQLYPNYRAINNAFNVGRDTNAYSGRPRNLSTIVYLARTNLIVAGYKDPNNYTNEFTRGYSLSFQDSEQNGNGSSTATFFLFGVTNKFFLDSVCLGAANHATGNTGTNGFLIPNSGAMFRASNGIARMSMFAVADEAGSNNAASNMKDYVDFNANNGLVDILADRFYVARDRTLINSNQTPTVVGTVVMGKGIIDVNAMILGFQEHSNKMDWSAAPFNYQPYLDYCQGTLVLTNGGTCRVNGLLTLGYTADNNPSSAAQQYNTFGRVSVLTGSTMIASNIVVDGGINFYDGINARQNSLTLIQGTLIISNSIGAAPGLPLDTLTMNSGTLQMPVIAGKTNVIVRTLSCPGTTPSIIKVASLTGVSVYPTNLPLISYSAATPFLAADTSVLGAGTNGYILIDSGHNLITLFLTTNAPKTLVWVGGDPNGPNTWNLTTTNWVVAGVGSLTNFAFGDIVTFDDSSIYTNVDIVDVVVPNQTSGNIGVTIANTNRQYTFNAAGGAIAGTAQLLKTGTNSVTFNAAEAGPFTITAGTVTNGGTLGSSTVYANAGLISSGTVKGSLITTGYVSLAIGSFLNGQVTIGGGVFINAGTVTVPLPSATFSANGLALVTNTADGTINLGGNTSSDLIDVGCTLANFGLIQTYANGSAGGRLFVRGNYFGTGSVFDALGGNNANSGRFTMDSAINQNPPTVTALISPGVTPNNSIGSMNFSCRLDLSGNNPQDSAGKFLIEIDQAGGVYDYLTSDHWNTIANTWVMTNWNGSFSSGQIYHILVNNAGPVANTVDTPTIWPSMWPPVPGPGLQWNLSRVQTWGDVMVTNSAMIWDGLSSTSWDTNNASVSWKSGQIYTNNMGAVFDERATTFTVTLSTPVAPAGYNTLTNPAGPANTFFTNSPSFLPGIVVSNSTHPYVFVASATPSVFIASTNNNGTNLYFGHITGMTSLYKTGSGSLTILTTNSFTGGVILDGGTLAFTNGAALGTVPGQRYTYTSLVMDSNATLKYFGPTNSDIASSGNRALRINPGGATIEISNAVASMTLSKEIYGEGALTKTGAGLLILSAPGNYYAGPTLLSQGTIQLVGAAAGSNVISMADGTTLQLTNNGNLNLTNAISMTGSTANMAVLGTTPKIVASGAWTGSGTVTFSNPPSSIFTFNAARCLSNYTGTVSFGLSSGNFMFNNSTNSNPCVGSTLATFDLGTSSATLSNLNGAALTYDLGGLAGGANTVLSGRFSNNLLATNGTSTYSIGANGNNTAFAGKIVDGVDYTSAGGNPSTVSVVKVGTGRLLLNGASTYTGGTTVSNGILGGTGSIAGNLTVAPGGTVSPGASVGKFTVGGNVVLNGAVFMELNRTSPTTNDQLSVGGSITANTGSLLVVTNIGPNLINGTKFQLFNKVVGGAGFTSVTLPGSPYTWANNIGSDGSITLTGGGVSTDAPVMTNSYSSSGGVLTLTWPSTNTGWRLMSNSVSIVNTSVWFQVIGAENTNKEILNVDLTKTNVFFRLQLP